MERCVSGKVDRIGSFAANNQFMGETFVVKIASGDTVNFEARDDWKQYMALVKPGDHIELVLVPKQATKGWVLLEADCPAIGRLDVVLAGMVKP